MATATVMARPATKATAGRSLPRGGADILIGMPDRCIWAAATSKSLSDVGFTFTRLS